MKKLSIIDKLQNVFTKEPLTAEEFGRDGYMLIRFLSMNPAYTSAMNEIQKYSGVLGHRLMPLLQAMFEKADKAPFLEYVKKEEGVKVFSEKATKLLKDLFGIGSKRLGEYLPNLWVTEDEVKEIWGMQ